MNMKKIVFIGDSILYGVHFNAQGSSLLSEFVIEYIERLL